MDLSTLFFEAKQKQSILAPIKMRIAVLHQLKKILKSNQQALIDAISTDYGYRSPSETLLAECLPLYKELDYIIRHIKQWTRPKPVHVDIWYQPARATIQLQPLGTVGIMVPWNYPLILALSPMIAAIAAGNNCLVKISEYTPCFGKVLAELINHHFSDYGINIINGDATLAAEFTQLPFNHLLFTGAPQIGKKVMAAASENLTPVTLELGGKSPVIIDNEINLKEAVTCILRGKLLNAGQTCIAPDYVLVPEQRKQEFIDTAKSVAVQMYPELKNNPDYSNIINSRHYQRLKNLLEDALQKGAEFIPLSQLIDGESQKFQPGLLINVLEEMQVMQDEIFGPLLPVKTYRDIDEALQYINSHSHPLTIYAFTRDKELQKVIDSQTISGSLCFNETLLQIVQNRLPFGGVGNSGFGHYRGKYGVETFSKLKPVYYQGRLHPANLFKPPYGAKFKALLKLLM